MPALPYYALEPEVAGELGDETVMDGTDPSPSVIRLEYRLGYGWQGDELLESWPCFVATERLCAALAAIDATGYALDDVLMSEDEQLADLGESYGELPRFHPASRTAPSSGWADVSGEGGIRTLGRG